MSCAVGARDVGHLAQVAVLAKKLTSERVSVTIEEGKLSVIIRDETGQQEYDLTTQLYGPIVTAESRWELLSTKVSPACVR